MITKTKIIYRRLLVSTVALITLAAGGYYWSGFFSSGDISQLASGNGPARKRMTADGLPVLRGSADDIEVWLGTTALFVPKRRSDVFMHDPETDGTRLAIDLSTGAIDFFIRPNGHIWRIRYLNGQVDMCGRPSKTVDAASELVLTFAKVQLSLEERERVRKASQVEGFDELNLISARMTVTGSCMDIVTITAQ